MRRLLLAIVVACPLAAPPGASAALPWSLVSATSNVDWSGRTLPAGVTERALDVNGVTTRVLEAGPADAREAVVFVHGFPGSRLDWAHLVGLTGRYARAVAFDMPGFGESAKPSGFPYTVEGEARFIAEALATLGIDRVDLVLHDFGGPYGLQWAAEHPAALRSVVLIDTGVFINYYGHPSALIWHTPGLGELFIHHTTRRTFGAEIQAGNPRLLPRAFIDRMWADFSDPAEQSAALQLYRSIKNPDKMGRAQAAALRRAPRRALVLWGATDQYIPAYVAYEQRQAFPGARVALLASGHWPFVDNVARVDSEMTDFHHSGRAFG
jgi:pimeloyl-ACP methyl ester carboxylesterase